MPSEKPLHRLEDILDNLARLERFTAGMDAAAFAANEQALYASPHALYQSSEPSTLAVPVMARLDRAIARGTVLKQMARSSRAMTEVDDAMGHRL